MLSKKKRQFNNYKIVLETNGIFILSFLFFLSSGLVFYLGASYGKSSRQIGNVLQNKDPLKKELAIQAFEASAATIKDSPSSVAEYEKKLALIDSSLNSRKAIATIQNNKQTKIFSDKKLPLKSTEDVLAKYTNLDNVVLPQKYSAQKPSSTKDNNNVMPKGKNKKHYTIQVAAMENPVLAKKLLENLRKSNFDAYIMAVPHKKSNVIYRVRVGNSLDKVSAYKILPKLSKKFAGLSVPSVEEFGKY